MSNIDSNITKASYMLKRLRDCGYKANKIIGNSDRISLEKDLFTLLDKIYPVGRTFTDKEIKESFKTYKTELLRSMYICPDYHQIDSRVWTILIDGGRNNIFLTFYKNFKDVDDTSEEQGDDYFEIYDGGQYIKPLRLRLNTLSVEVIVEHLTRMGIILKFNDC